MDITRSGTQPSKRGSSDYFSGVVWMDPVPEAPPPARIRTVRVSFEPGARTFWHTHPLGQSLHIVSGICLVQSWGGPVRQARTGDIVWIPPGEKHWHGAGPETGMVHIAWHEALDGAHVDWLEEVSPEQYAVVPEA